MTHRRIVHRKPEVQILQTLVCEIGLLEICPKLDANFSMRNASQMHAVLGVPVAEYMPIQCQGTHCP